MPDAIKRYEIAQQYLDNQTDAGWHELVMAVLQSKTVAKILDDSNMVALTDCPQCGGDGGRCNVCHGNGTVPSTWDLGD